MNATAMTYSRLHSILYRYWWLTFFLLGVSFVLFGLFSLNLLHALGANFDFLLSYGFDAVREGGLRQFVELVVSGYLAATAYVFFKVCEKVLVERLCIVKSKGTDT
jgi:hypothetical protein